MKAPLLAMLLLGLGGFAHAEDDSLQVRTVTLKNGLVVVMAPDSRAPAADVAVWYRAGSRFERSGTSGISYLFARLMFRGSRAFAAGEHRRLLEAEGAVLNFVVNPDYSCLYETLPPEAVELALRLEADRMAYLVLTQERLDADRQSILAERRARLGSPVGRGLQRFYATAFPGHPYGRPVIGHEEDLRGITLKQVRDFYIERYAPQNAILTVVGRFDPAATLAAVRRYFGPLPQRPATRAPASKPAPQQAERRAAEVGSGQGTILFVGWRGPAATDPDRPAVELLSHVLWGGPSPRLQRALPRELFLRAEGDLDQSQEASLLFCIAALAPGADTARAESLVVAEVEKLASQPLPAERLEAAKRQLEVARLFGWQTARGRAEALGSAQILEGDHRAAADRLEQVRRITAADLQRAASRVLKASGRTVVWMLPSGGPAETPPAQDQGQR